MKFSCMLNSWAYRCPILPLHLATARPHGLDPRLGAGDAAVDGPGARVVRRLNLQNTPCVIAVEDTLRATSETTHRSPEILALVGRVDLALEGGRRDRVVQRLDDLVVDGTGLAKSVLR